MGRRGAGTGRGAVAERSEDAATDAHRPPRGGRSRTTVLSWAACAVPVIFLAQRAWALRWMNDDGFITLRVVRQLVQGHGPVFNAGERVEAATSVLWVSTLAFGDLFLPLRLEWIAVVLGIALTLAGLTLALLAGRSVAGSLGPGAVLVPVGLVVFVAVKPVWIFSSSGLEGGLVTAWLGGSLWLLQRWAASGDPLRAAPAVVLGLGPLIRPELALQSAALLAAVLVGERARGWRGEARVLAWALALPVAYQVVRMGYYGVLVPNTAVAKEAAMSRWDAGWDYFGAFVDPYWLWLPLLVLAAGAYAPLVDDLWRRARWRQLLVVAAFVLGGALQVLYIVRLGGDYIESRLLLPAFFAMLAPVAVVPVRPRYAAALLVLPWAVVSTLFFRSSIDDTTFANDNLVTTDDFGWGAEGPLRHQALSGGPGVYYNERRLPGVEPSGRRATVYGSYGIGLSGYALPDVYVLDMLGLADPLTAHFRLEHRGLSGHEKPMPTSWFVARATVPGTDLDEEDFGPFPLLFPAVPPEHGVTEPFDERVADARAALGCRELERFRASYTEPLTVGRFLRNVFESFEHTSLRIPTHPREAREQVCDGR